MNKLKLIAGILLIFCVGTFAGVLGTGAYFTHRIERFARPGHRPPIARLLMKRLTHKLDLTETQQAEVREIVNQTRVKLHDLRGKYLPEMEAIIESNLKLVKEKLNAEQKKKIDEMYTKLKERWRDREASRGMTAHRTPRESVEQLKTVLGLTEAQQVKVRQIIQDGIKNRHEIVRKYRKRGRVLEGFLRQEIQESRNMEGKRLASVLTKNQMDKYMEFEKKHPRGSYPEMHLHHLMGF